MERYLLIIGILFNAFLILINRYIKHLPDRIYIPLMVLGIGMMIAGAFLLKG